MSQKVRIRELDLLRGIAVILMILYHIAFDLNFFGIYKIPLTNFPWEQMARVVQVIFIVTTGFTFTLSSNKKKRLRHLFILAIFALSITLITWLFFGNYAVKFGILHFFALAILLTIPLEKLGAWNFMIGLPFLLLGSLFNSMEGPEWLLPLGIHGTNFQSLDYFPLIPWYGLFLQGVALGSYFKKTRFFTNYRALVRIPFLEKIGSHSLFIYLVHQPLIAGVILLLRMISSS